MKPKILIIGEEGFAKNLPHFVINKDYSAAVAKAGGLPLLALDAFHPDNYVELADGLFLTGGHDIHCGRYGEVYQQESDIPPLSRGREMLEFKLCQLFMEAKKPIFGVGRGLQVLNVALGGSLYRDISNHAREYSMDEYAKAQFVFHPVKIKNGSKLSLILEKEEIVNSCHHQAVKNLGQGLISSALTEDGTIEAVEHETLPCFAVQWHPERAVGDLSVDDRLFERFILMCKEGSR